MRRTVGERIKDRRLELGLSADWVAEKLGKDRSTYYRYESNDIENMPMNILRPLAKILGVSEAYLITGQDEIPMRRVPILGEIAAGSPILAEEQYCEHVELEGGIQVDFCLRVQGDSMIDARICDGDLVFIRKQPVVENGEIAAVLIGEEVTLKRFYRTAGGIILKPENRNYDPEFYSEEEFHDIRILGKAVMFQSML